MSYQWLLNNTPINNGTAPEGSLSPDENGPYLKPPFNYNTCLDRHGTTVDGSPDGLIKTSKCLADILSWENSQGENTGGGISSAEDEAITAYVRVFPTGTRTIAVDPNNNIWVGGITSDNCARHELLYGTSGIPVAGSRLAPSRYEGLNLGGYGGLVDAYGVLWSSSGYQHTFGLLHLAPNPIHQMPPAGIVSQAATDYNGVQKGDYGLAIDPNNQTVYYSSCKDGVIYEVFSDGTLGQGFPIRIQNNQTGSDINKVQGLAVDARGNLWAARSTSQGRSIAHLRCSDGNFLGNAQLDFFGIPPGPTGVAVDSNGKIWSANYNLNNAMRINPNLGFAGDDRPIGAVDLIVDLGDGTEHQPPYQVAAMPYNYSDMTGFVVLGSTYPCGFWDFVQDGGFNNLHWRSMTWSSNDDPHVRVEARAANSITELPSRDFMTVVKNQYLYNLTGRFIEIRVTLFRPYLFPTNPTLSDFTIHSPIL